MSEASLKNKRILLTGAGRGIGLGAARHFIKAGAKLFIVGRVSEHLENLKSEAGDEVEIHSLAVDLGEPSSADAIAATVAKQWGALDILVNNAGVHLEDALKEGGFSKEPADMLEKTMSINLLAPHRLIKALLPLLEKGAEPKIVNVSSEAGRESSVEMQRKDPSYVLSKYSLNGLTRLWAHELKGRIAVNSMHPGWIRSDMGGPSATDDLETGGKRIFDAAAQPANLTGQFWYGLETMKW